MDKLKTCKRCGKQKPESDFNKNTTRNDGLQSDCRACDRERKRVRYQQKGDEIRDRNNKHIRRIRRAARLEAVALLVAYLKLHPCVDCGETDPIVLEFDHLRDKKHNIASMIGRRCWDDILKEIEKCQVCCANCHKRRTAKRRGWAKLTQAAAPDSV